MTKVLMFWLALSLLGMALAISVASIYELLEWAFANYAPQQRGLWEGVIMTYVAQGLLQLAFRQVRKRFP